MSSALCHNLYWHQRKLIYTLDYSPCHSCIEEMTEELNRRIGYEIRPYCDACKRGGMVRCNCVPFLDACLEASNVPVSLCREMQKLEDEIEDDDEWSMVIDPDKFGLEVGREYQEEEIIDILNAHGIPNPRAKWEDC